MTSASSTPAAGGAARRPRAGRRCARSRARSSGTRRCARRSVLSVTQGARLVRATLGRCRDPCRRARRGRERPVAVATLARRRGRDRPPRPWRSWRWAAPPTSGASWTGTAPAARTSGWPAATTPARRPASGGRWMPQGWGRCPIGPGWRRSASTRAMPIWRTSDPRRPDRVEPVIEAEGELESLRIRQKQPAQRGRTRAATCTASSASARAARPATPVAGRGPGPGGACPARWTRCSTQLQLAR